MYAPETPSGAESSMASKKKTRNGGTKDGDEKDTKKNTNGKFPCQEEPKHEECDGAWTDFHNTSRKCGYEWKLKWAACRQDDAIKFMKTKHGHTYNPDPPNQNDPKPVTLYSKKKHPQLYRFVFGYDPRPSQHQPAKVTNGRQHTRPQAADRHQHQHHWAQPPRASDLHGARLLHMLQQDSSGHQGHDPRVEAWMAEHGAPETAMPLDQSRVPYDDMASNPGKAFDQDMAPPQSMTGAENMAAAPVMPPSHEAMPDGKQPKRHHHSSRQRPRSDHSGNHHRHHRRRSSQEPNPEQGPHPSEAMPPDAPEGLIGPPDVLPTPVIHTPQAPPDGQRHRGRRHKSTREPESGLEQYPHPGPSMPAGMVLPTGMPVPPVMPSAQGVMGGQQPQHHRREPSVYSSHQQTPLSPADMPPPPTMRECMEVMAEEAFSAPAEEPQAGGMATDPRMRNMPPPMNPMMSAPPTRNMPMRRGPQPSPAPPAAAMYGPASTQLPPTGAPQAGGITTAAGPSKPPSQNLPLRQPRPQPTNPGMFLRSAGAAGTPGSQAMAMRPPPGALSTTPGSMPQNPRRQTPPMSMPPFPGTSPGTPASLNLARAPPPPAPTPPFPPGALD